MNNFNNENLKKERKFLDDVSKTYRSSIYHKIKQEFIMKTYYPFISRFNFGLKGRMGLQLGCSEGYETECYQKF